MSAKSRPRLRAGNVLLCDDVRAEQNGKFTIIGAIAGDVLISHFPAVVRFGLYVELFAARLGRSDHVVRLIVGDEERLRAVGSAEFRNIRDPATLAVSGQNIPIPHPCNLQVELEYEGKKTTILEKQIRGDVGAQIAGQAIRYSEA